MVKVNPKLLELVERQLEAYNKQDLETFCSCYADDIQVLDLSRPNRDLHGMESFRKVYQELFAKFPENRVKVLTRILQNDVIVDQEEITGRGGQPLYATAAYQIVEERIGRVWFWW